LDIFATITYKNGKTAKQEFYYGNSFLSQSGRFMIVDHTMVSVTITESNGHTRRTTIQ
jgi:hypothetical protein